MSKIASPCILVCSIDLKTGYCFGCGRTGKEITNWAVMSNQERASIMDGLNSRLQTIKRRPRRMTKRQKMAKSRI